MKIQYINAKSNISLILSFHGTNAIDPWRNDIKYLEWINTISIYCVIFRYRCTDRGQVFWSRISFR